MFPGQNDQFGAPIEPEGGFSAGGIGGPPSADSMFESFLEGDDEIEVKSVRRQEERDSEVLAAGLDFFEKMRSLR